jgi:hypothetical protein
MKSVAVALGRRARQAGVPPPIVEASVFVGTTTTVNAPVDFGIGRAARWRGDMTE